MIRQSNMSPKVFLALSTPVMLLCLLALTASFDGHAQTVASAGQAVIVSAKTKTELSKQMEEAVGRGEIAGVVEAVIGRDGLLYLGSAGKLDVTADKPIVNNAIFSIASMTKPLTSVAVMLLFEQGKLKLDDPISKFLPGFDDLRVITKFNEKDGSYETRPAARQLSIRHLLTHTGGIGYAFSNPIEHRLTELTKKPEWELPLLNDPGERWVYGPSTRVLGMIVEKISGLSLEAYFQQNILGPLQMTDTSFAVPLPKQDRVISMQQRLNGTLKELPKRKIPGTPAAPFLGDGGLYSTVEDYGKFVQMLLNSGRATSKSDSTRILKESSLKMMAENQIGPLFLELQTGGDESLSKPFPDGAGRDKFGLGFQIASGTNDNPGVRSRGSLSWSGLFNTRFWVDPAKQIGGVQMMQMLPFNDEGARRVFHEFEQTVYQNLRH